MLFHYGDACGNQMVYEVLSLMSMSEKVADARMLHLYCKSHDKRSQRFEAIEINFEIYRDMICME